MDIWLLSPLSLFTRWPSPHLVSRPVKAREKVISWGHMDVAWQSGSPRERRPGLLSKVLGRQSLQVCVSHPCFLGIVGHLCSLSVRTSGFAECRWLSMLSKCESTCLAIWIAVWLVCLGQGDYEGQTFGSPLIGPNMECLAFLVC